MRLLPPCPHLPNPKEAASLAALVPHRSMTLSDTRAAAPLRARLALDPRALALLRAGLGLLLAVDAGLRLFSAGALYADTGLLPRAIAVELLGPLQWSLHLANGSLVFALAMAALQLLAAMALTIGWRSRRAGALLWLLLVSAFTRHPAVVGASDLLALSLLSLGLFLPWNARWSVDAALAPERRDADEGTASWPDLVLRAYVALLPVWLALATLDATGGLDGLLVSEHANALGHGLASALPGSLGIVETALRFAAFLVLPLALWPWSWASRAAAALYVLLALPALVLLHAGALPWLGLLGAGLLIDGALWDRLGGRVDQPELRLHYDRDAAGAASFARLLRTFLCLPRTRIAAAQDDPRASRLLESGRLLVVIDRDEQAHLDGAGIAVLLRRSPLLAPLRPLLASGLGTTLAGAALGLRRLGVCLHRIGTDPASTLDCRRTASVAAPALFIALTLSNAIAASLLPRALDRVVGTPLQAFGLERPWLEALPSIDGTRRWITVVGERIDGGEVDATDPGLRAADYAPRTPPWFTTAHARAYAQALARPGANEGAARQALARFLCAEHATSLARIRVTLMVREAGATVAEQRVLLRHECRPDETQ